MHCTPKKSSKTSHGFVYRHIAGSNNPEDRDRFDLMQVKSKWHQHSSWRPTTFGRAPSVSYESDSFDTAAAFPEHSSTSCAESDPSLRQDFVDATPRFIVLVLKIW
jgi:hypothetical protein